jgi:hypothetical protein
MAKTTTWKITDLTCYPQSAGQTDVVFQIKWMCTVNYLSSDGEVGFQQKQAGSCELSYSEGDPFTPYSDLTEDQVWGWVDAQVDRSAVEDALNAEIDAQVTPTQVNPPLPWAS